MRLNSNAPKLSPQVPGFWHGRPRFPKKFLETFKIISLDKVRTYRVSNSAVGRGACLYIVHVYRYK